VSYFTPRLIDQEIPVFRTIQMSNPKTYFEARNGFICWIVQGIQRRRSQNSTGEVSLKSDDPFRRDLVYAQTEYNLHTNNIRHAVSVLW
jgi:hypothetical protein